MLSELLKVQLNSDLIGPFLCDPVLLEKVVVRLGESKDKPILNPI